MKKTLVIIFAIATLGLIGYYANGQDSNSGSNVSANPSSATAAGINSTSQGTYKDGTYNGSAAETPYGTVQVAAVVSGGKIADIKFIKMPNDQRHSVEVTNFSEPLLKESTIAKQNANIDFVTGATSTCYGYQESLQAALDKAKVS